MTKPTPRQLEVLRKMGEGWELGRFNRQFEGKCHCVKKGDDIQKMSESTYKALLRQGYLRREVFSWVLSPKGRAAITENTQGAPNES